MDNNRYLDINMGPLRAVDREFYRKFYREFYIEFLGYVGKLDF